MGIDESGKLVVVLVNEITDSELDLRPFCLGRGSHN